ncbi:hypothetical protein AD017_33095 (plasmid) [Pseudonocardia sp. EC080619-01]|nr:hypothetical protein AD017_33095 [Pseudonocardia sp. EC080619-01]
MWPICPIRGGLGVTELTDRFVRDGFVHLPGAVPEPVARACERLLWEETGYDPDDPMTWVSSTHWVLYRDDEPFVNAVNSPTLVATYDQLVGPDRWRRRDHVGAFPLRFPSKEEPLESGWHIDAAFPDRELTDDDLESVETMREVGFRVNVNSDGRALLLLMLFSNVGADDSPTRIRIGSHLDVPQLLDPYGSAGVDSQALSSKIEQASASRPVTHATGRCGDVYVCHPFLVHAAQTHRGMQHRFMAQNAIEPADALEPRARRPLSPVEQAIRAGLDD